MSAYVTRAMREKFANEAFERNHPEVEICRREEISERTKVISEIAVRWPLLSSENVREIEDYRSRRFREIELSLRTKYSKIFR